MLEWTALVLGAALAASGADALDAADRSFAQGDRRAARSAWRTLESDPDPAVAAQAATRLLLVSGNLGFAVHGPRADRALDRCAEDDPRCLLAAADYELLLHQLGLPGDPELALVLAEEAEEALPAAAADRIAWARVQTRAADRLPEPQTGTGEAVAAGRGQFGPWPGTWVLGLGVVGAPGLGVGGALRYTNPDLGWRGWRLQTEALGTSRGVLSGQLAVRSAGHWFGSASAWGLRRPFDVYADNTRSTTLVSTAEVRLGGGHRRGRWVLEAGPVGRWDAVDATVVDGHGSHVSAIWRRDGLSAAVRSTQAYADYAHVDVAVDLRPTLALGRHRIAFRALAAAAPLASSPLVRLPALGGGEGLRSAPVGRFRSSALGAAVAEWRSPAWGLLGAVAFAEGAWVRDAGWQAGGGGGLRLFLPPRPLNTVRLDVAAGTVGWAATAGVGSAF